MSFYIINEERGRRMRVAVIHGSPRKGNTEAVVEELKKHLQAEFEDVYLKDVGLEPCVGCYACFNKGEQYCPHGAKVSEIRGVLERADGFIISSPVYSLQITGLLKTMIDHFSYFFHRPAFQDKKAMIVVTTAGAGQQDCVKYLRNVLEYWGISQIESLGMRVPDHNLIYNEKNARLIQKKAHSFKDLLEGRKHSKPHLRQIYKFAIWKGVNACHIMPAIDYDYWKAKGWLEASYYYPVRGKYLGQFIGRSISGIMRRVIKVK